ncbi:hypothetical protein [Streptomyces sp. NPDC056660]|uniref:hypothetical protein n=1 Tax=Streptomyces sp. NPDC056660 TaxID=3345897 RepID=UPI0036C67074
MSTSTGEPGNGGGGDGDGEPDARRNGHDGRSGAGLRGVWITVIGGIVAALVGATVPWLLTHNDKPYQPKGSISPTHSGGSIGSTGQGNSNSDSATGQDGGDSSSGQDDGATASQGSNNKTIKGNWWNKRGSLKVTVSQVDNESGHIRLHIRVDNGYPNAVELDDAGGYFVAHDDRGHSYNGNYFASQWPATVPAGGPMWGVIELEGFIQPGARHLSISFTHTFSDSFDAPDNIGVDNISLPS